MLHRCPAVASTEEKPLLLQQEGQDVQEEVRQAPNQVLDHGLEALLAATIPGIPVPTDRRNDRPRRCRI